MLITITDLRNIQGAEMRSWSKAGHAMRHEGNLVLSMSPHGSQKILDIPGGPARPSTLEEMRHWFQWQAKHGRSNQRFVEAGLPHLADD